MGTLLILASVLMLTSDIVFANNPSTRPARPKKNNNGSKRGQTVPEEDPTDVEEAFLNARIVPDVVDKPPPNLLTAAFTTANITSGNKISPCRTVIAPTINYKADSNKNYTFMLLDADASSRTSPMLRSYIITLSVNIPGSNMNKGCSICPYIPCTPTPGSEPHRYVLLVYEQSKEINVMSDDLLSLNVFRSYFSPKDFAAKYGLTNLIAGNYFTSEIPGNYADYCR